MPHVVLAAHDRESLAEDPEEYGRANACGEAAEDGDGEWGGGVTSRGAALDFLERLARVDFERASAPVAKKTKRTKRNPASGTSEEPEEDDGSDGFQKPTVGEVAARDVVDEILSGAPKEKVERIGKAASASGDVFAHVAPVAEAAIGESSYFGVLRVQGALTVSRRRAKESATRQFCRKHAFPAVAAAASPHVVVAAAAHCAEIAAKITDAQLAREAFSALVAAMERPTPAPSGDMDEIQTEEAWRVTRDVASWAARAVASESPRAAEAFGATSAAATIRFAERLVALAEHHPARGAAPLRALAALAEAGAGALAPETAGALAVRVAGAFAGALPSDDEGESDDSNADDATALEAWETSLEAVAGLCEAAGEHAECFPNDEAGTRERDAKAKMKLAVNAVSHVAAYWKAAVALEPPSFAVRADFDDFDDFDAIDDFDATRACSSDPFDAVHPPTHPAAAAILRFACETLAESAEDLARGGSMAATAGKLVWSAAGTWASYLPAWRAKENDDGVDETAFETLTAIVNAAVRSNADDAAIAEIAMPGARAAASALAETENDAIRFEAARAVAAAVSAYASAAAPEVVSAARDLVDSAVGRRAARIAMHVLVAVAAASPPSVAEDPDGWMRARDEAASAGGWTAGADGADEALLAAHVDACAAMLRACTRPGACAPEKRLLVATLEEAMRCASELLERGDEAEDGASEEESDSESDSDAESDSDDAGTNKRSLENETESEFLERYAAIARDMAETELNGGEADDDEGVMEDDSSFNEAFSAAKGDGIDAAKRFRVWFEEWTLDGSSGSRVAALVDAAVARRFEKRDGKKRK
jgi:hypothetical protein